MIENNLMPQPQIKLRTTRGRWHPKTAAQELSNLAPTAVWIIWVLALLWALFVALWYGYRYPWSDDWNLIPVLTGAQPLRINWLWAQHNEHRIVIPKLLDWISFQLTGGDFRGPILINILSMGALSFAMVKTAQRLRGYVTFTDAFFPLALLHMGQSAYYWGFQTQFVSSTILLGALLLVLVHQGCQGIVAMNTKSAVALGSCLLLLPLCGGNGVIPAVPLALYLGARGFHGWRSATASKLRRNGLILILFAVFALGLIALSFIGYQSPPHHNWPRPSLWAILSTTLHLLVAPFGHRFQDWWQLTSLLVVTMLVGTTWRSVRMLLRPGTLTGETGVRARLPVMDILAFLATMTLLAGAIAWGRAGRGWPPGVEDHYAPIELPLYCCVYFFYEIYGMRAGRRLVHGAMVIYFSILFVAYLPYSIQCGRYLRSQTHAIDKEVFAGKTVEEIVENHTKELFFEDTPDIRRLVADGLRMLQERGVECFQNLGTHAEAQNSPGKEQDNKKANE